MVADHGRPLPAVSHVAAATGAYPRRAGNAVRPLIDGEPAFRRICEAVEAARARVWVTVAFIDRDLVMPDGLGTPFDVLDRAAARGVDVRMLFWREPELEKLLPGSGHFPGTDEERAWLAARGSRLRARWDHVPRYCHHQKSWVIDAGEPGEAAFVGGINLDQGSIVAPGHPIGPHPLSVHDLYVEVRGPAATDAAHNFVQRWNEASERAAADGVWPDPGRADALPFPRALAAAAGPVAVQIVRTVRGGRYRDPTPPPGAAPFPIADGEKSVLEQYVAAIDAAARTIYIENQFIISPQVLERLDAALRRGVEVVFLLPSVPMPEMVAARSEPKHAAFFRQLGDLGRHRNFTLAGLAARRGPGQYDDVYVHAKVMLVDDAWATIGSANVATRSFHGDTELNASFWDAGTVRALRVELLREHLALDTTGLDDREALARYRAVAGKNRSQRERGEALTGLAFGIAPEEYATGPEGPCVDGEAGARPGNVRS